MDSREYKEDAIKWDWHMGTKTSAQQGCGGFFLSKGHLKSTIIGDALTRMLEFSNVEVLRKDHVGDWGTQFGMLIEYLFEKFPSLAVTSDQSIGDLEGESFYNPYIPGVLEKLDKKGLIEESKGARIIFIEGKKIPLIVVKSDGGFNYASTDLPALWYRLYEEKVDWIIYVTDVGQKEHFEMFLNAAKRADWLPDNDSLYQKISHVAFGLVLGEDGKKFRTRSTEVKVMNGQKRSLCKLLRQLVMEQ